MVDFNVSISEVFTLVKEFVYEKGGRTFAEFAKFVHDNSNVTTWEHRRTWLKFIWDASSVKLFAGYDLDEVGRKEALEIINSFEYEETKFNDVVTTFEEVYESIGALLKIKKSIVGFDDLPIDLSMEDVANWLIESIRCYNSGEWATEDALLKLEEQLEDLLQRCRDVRKSLKPGAFLFEDLRDGECANLAQLIIETYECEEAFAKFVNEYKEELNEDSDPLMSQLMYDECWEGMMEYVEDFPDIEDIASLPSFKVYFREMFKAELTQHEGLEYLSGDDEEEDEDVIEDGEGIKG